MLEDEEREKLAKVIQQWNNNRLDLFEISQPDEVSCRQPGGGRKPTEIICSCWGSPAAAISSLCNWIYRSVPRT